MKGSPKWARAAAVGVLMNCAATCPRYVAMSRRYRGVRRRGRTERAR